MERKKDLVFFLDPLVVHIVIKIFRKSSAGRFAIPEYPVDHPDDQERGYDKHSVNQVFKRIVRQHDV
jgi:hypothetical protein